jgi:chromate transporter
VLPAPFYRKFAHRPGLEHFVAGVTAAAVGAIAGAAFVLGRRAIIDGTTAAIALVVLAILLRFKKVPEPLLILAAGQIGLLVSSA